MQLTYAFITLLTFASAAFAAPIAETTGSAEVDLHPQHHEGGHPLHHYGRIGTRVYARA
jgi:Spy/CpxP family protein refolding chaperone